jgi:enterobactin synthetase component D
MNSISIWSSLFKHSSFFGYQKSDVLDSSLKKLLSELDYQNIDHFHPKRKDEFLLGRLCASKAHELHFGSVLLSLPVAENRSPLWPKEVIGSITHNQFWVGAAVAKSNSLLGVGIDFEVMGRTKLEISRYVRTPKDLISHASLSDIELLTIIFSAKESLYKALHPSVKCFFGFETAAVTEIDLISGTFKIDLISDISKAYGPSGRAHFEGQVKIIDKSCLTVLEIPHET